MELSDYRILIVGQGIAGTVLSHKLWQRNISHAVIDNKHKNAATQAAAGIINPITGRNYVKSWMIDHLLPEAKATYNSIGDLLGSTYYREINILRSLHTPAQENKWYNSIDKPGYSNYIVDNSELGAFDAIVNNAKAYGEIQQSAQVNIAKLTADYRSFLMDHDMYIESELQYTDLKLSETKLGIKDLTFDLVIFCEGYRVMQNPFFETDFFRPAKGEALTVTIDRAVPNKILRDDIFLAPTKGQNYWTGGTYVWDYRDDLLTDTFKNKWTEKLDNLVKVPYQVIDHKAGVRPSTKDRRPCIGISPQSDRLYMFNGMGTKGTSLVPYWANHLIEHLFDGVSLDSEVDIRRFMK